ncbi:uncharacterized protein LOC134148452 isoform X19 [Rhea pennata]|uniref:uncharacterized protein LOC134148452 isoform X19 n=1 Tax=Rhea pennata TaxID=8795 RepID=UPI002E258F92
MKHGAGGPKHSEEVSANQLLLRALAGQSPGAITPASSESLSRREEEEEEEEEKEGERKPRATPKEEREVAAGSGHCRDGWTLPVGQILGRRTQPTFYPGGRGAMAKGAAVDRSRDVSSTSRATQQFTPRRFGRNFPDFCLGRIVKTRKSSPSPLL